MATTVTHLGSEIKQALTKVKEGRQTFIDMFGNPDITFEQMLQVEGMFTHGVGEPKTRPSNAARVLNQPTTTAAPKRRIVATSTTTPTAKPKMAHHWLVAHILNDSKNPMNVDQLNEELKARGWHSENSANPKAMISQALYGHKDLFLRPARGLFSLAQGVKLPEISAVAAETSAPATPKRSSAEVPKGSLFNKTLHILKGATTGLSVSTLAGMLAVDVKELQPVLKQGLDTGSIRREGERRGTVYFIGAATEGKTEDVPETSKVQLAGTNEEESESEPNVAPAGDPIDIEAAVNDVLLKTDQSITIADIVKTLGLDGQHRTVGMYMQTLEKFGIVSKDAEKSPGGQILWEVNVDKLKERCASQKN